MKRTSTPARASVVRRLVALALALAIPLVWPAGQALAGPSPEAQVPGRHADDPGIERSIEGVLHEARTGSFSPPPTGPHGARFKLFYKGYEFMCALANPSCVYSGMGFMFYPTAFLDVSGFWRALRLGIGLTAAGESKQDRTRWWQHNFGMEVALAVGLQYPARFTPYAELLLGLGALHWNIYNKDEIDFAYSVGIEVGFEVFLTGYFSLGASVGWRRSMVNTDSGTFYANSWTVSVGFGL